MYRKFSLHFAESHASTVWGVDFDSTGDRLVSCSDDRTLKVWKAYRPGNSQGNQLPMYLLAIHSTVVLDSALPALLSSTN